jgi:hypothetical protein
MQSIDLWKAWKRNRSERKSARLSLILVGSSSNDVPRASFKPLEPDLPGNGGGLVKMKSKILFLTLAVLLCLTVQIYALSNMAKGQCGTNPLGDTSGDTEFYVSKNQNAPASDMSSAASSSGKAAVALGSTVAVNATIQSLNPDKPSPQGPGVSIVWKVEAANPNNEKMLYDYLLKGPATGGKLLDKTGWIAESSWTWNTTDADAGENQIEVRVMRAGADGVEGNMTQSFEVSAATQKNETSAVDMTPVDTTAVASALDTSSANDASNVATKTASIDSNPHPGSKTADTSSANEDTREVTKTESVDANSRPESKTADTKIGKPRIAPDERPRQPTTTAGGLTPGPNMSMPDPSPKSPSSETETDATQSEVVPEESRIMEVDGKWTVKLENEGATINPLTLIQTGESVMGMGTLNEQNTKLQVSAKGSVSNNAMSLEAWTIVSEYGNKIDKHIELELVKVDKVITGSYEMYSGEDLIGKGNATASRFAA